MSIKCCAPTKADYRWQLDALNDRLMNWGKYEALGENVALVIDKIQRWLMAYDNSHCFETNGTGVRNMTVLPIHFYREKAGLTRAELAEKVGLTESHIKMYEGGFESPTIEVAEKIANALGVTLYDLAKGAKKQ